MEIEYKVTLTSEEALSGINVSANIPEGTELVEGSISDNGVVTDGKISWKVDVDTEKVVSFKVTVTATSGDISFVATVNGKDTNTVTNTIDEAPVVTAIDPNKYQMEVGTEYVEKGYSAIDKEDGDITDKVELSYRFQAKDAPTWENPDPTELDTSRLGTYKITYTVTDSMGNVGKATRVVEIVDTQAPVISGLDDGEYVNKNEIVTITDATLDIVTINGVEQEFEGTEFQDKLTHEGTFVIVAIDKAGNRTEKTVSIDKTPAVKSATNILVLGDINENKVFYATIGDTIQAYVSFNEKLAHNPTFILINDGKEYTMDESLVTAQKPNKDGKYVYQILYKIEEDTTFVDGEITLRVTDLEDMYGNKIADETKPTNGHIVYFDKTAPMYTNLGILNVTHYRNNVKNNANEDINHITDGDEIRILVKFEEKLAVEPKVMINNDKELVFDCTYRPDSSKEGSYYYYMADIKITPEMNLPEGEEIQFKVYGYEDVAGNVGEELDNSKINSIYYKKVIYDNQDPTSTFVRIQNNTPTAKSPDYAKVGDSVWVYVIFDEKLSVEPEFTIAGEPATIIQREDGEDKGQTWYKYAASITMTEDMEEGNIDFTISGYKDLAGNEGTEISGTTDGSAIKFDKTNPYLEVKNGTDNQGDKYTVGSEEDKKFSRISFKLHDNMALKEYVINGNVEQVTNKDGIKTSDANYNNIKKHLKENEENTIILVDKAGNKSEEYTFYYDITAPVIEVNEKDTFEVGVDTYDYPEAGSVTDNCDATRGLASAVHMHWYKVNADGTETEVTPFKWGSTLADRELGKYHITYETSDKAGNIAKADRYVTLQDTTAPVIEVNEKDTFEIGVDTYDYPEDITVTDNRDGNMPVGNVNIVWYYATPEGEKGEVAYSENFPWDTNLKGVVEPGTTYYIEYWIKDAEGNRGEAHRLLTFVDNTDPEITLDETEDIHFDTVEEAANFDVNAGVTVTDNCDENIQIQVQINWYDIEDPELYEYNVSSVGANGEGRYNIVYTAKDASGNDTVLQRLVYVGMQSMI